MGVARARGAFGDHRVGCVFWPDTLGVEPWRDYDGLHYYGMPGVVGAQPATSAGANPGAATGENASVADSELDKNELQLLQEIYGVLRKDGSAYKTKDAKTQKLVDDVAAYVSDRDAYFGSADDYKTYRATAKAELDADGAKLRRFIEPPLNSRKGEKWKDAQEVFYAWVRKGYEKEVGAGTDIPKLIRSGMSEAMKEALKKVETSYGKKFKAGGMNPRPMKLSGKYRLGTLSDHATGTAVDVDASSNPQIPSATWSAILKYTGKSLDHATRKSKWKSKPKDLYDTIKEISDEFVKKVGEAVKKEEEAAKKEQQAAEEAAKKAGKPAPKPKKVDALDAAIAKDADLKKVGKAFISKYHKTGFLGLEWSLVEAFHKAELTWGATYPDVDLHHFSL
ncbi:MAG: hypothetical protein HRU76_07260 [Phycisphaeraceae bacterium]|nr:hypothetical protein [Phycisphaerales bacterium]QOJ17385.1 MAG: hypothetical protein HRU76_07260 [Phycisphaeraceae bacterium]